MKNNFKITLYSTLILMLAAFCVQPFGICGFVMGLIYAQIIEWFVHGWIQHYPFRVFRAYRKAHNYHHAHPNEPRAVQPIQYFIIGSFLLIAPFWWVDGFLAAYFLMYALINIIHHDLHSAKRMLPEIAWNTSYFKLIEAHHKKHHSGHNDSHSTHSVTNPFLDYLFDKIRLTRLNNSIAKKLKI